MWSVCGLISALSLLLVLSTSQAASARRRFREIQSTVLSEPLLSDLRQDQIPVKVVKVLQPELAAEPLRSFADAAAEAVSSGSTPLGDEIRLPATEALKIAEIQKKVEEVEHGDVFEEKPGVTEALSDAGNAVKQSIQHEPEAQPNAAEEEKHQALKGLLKADEIASAGEKVGGAEEMQSPAEATEANVRQATQATPTQSSTPQNFVQQLIQPLGQFISQFTGGQQQQAAAQVVNDQPITPGPTLPGFLNPAAAITSAQQAVQNVVNSTSQAFQGLQQLASNLGTSFQNTLSNLGGQQNQASSGDATTARPPGPIQAIVSNLIGGNQPAAAAPDQPQGPLQGIISFFQGGTRPQSTPLAIAPTTQPPKPEPAAASSEGGAPAAVDDKIGGPNADEQLQPESNEVRRGEQESSGDSFEETHPDGVIAV